MLIFIKTVHVAVLPCTDGEGIVTGRNPGIVAPQKIVARRRSNQNFIDLRAIWRGAAQHRVQYERVFSYLEVMCRWPIFECTAETVRWLTCCLPPTRNMSMIRQDSQLSIARAISGSALCCFDVLAVINMSCH